MTFPNAAMKTSLRISSYVRRTRFLPIAALVVLAGCSVFKAQSDATRYYLLSAPETVAADANAAIAAKPAIGLRRIELPAYLRTAAIALRSGGTELRYATDARWAEPLEQSVAQVLASALQYRVAAGPVTVYPAPYAARPVYEVAVKVLACEGVDDSAGRQVRFVAWWEIRETKASPDAAPLASGAFTAPAQEWAAGDYADLTAKLGEAVSALGIEIGRALAR